ncbi:MAG TPA: tetratricopeptide repeat protein, partial [Vicinamibacterales bacterium]|nr:tetratricopeptide repeat protein [Vicinamibacterales bacterium]
VHLGRTSEAIAVADHVLMLDASIANAYLAKTAALRQQGRFDEAEACLRTGLSHHPQHQLLRHALLNPTATKVRPT